MANGQRRGERWTAGSAEVTKDISRTDVHLGHEIGPKSFLWEKKD